MRPGFDNTEMNTLYYCLMRGSAIAAGLAFTLVSIGFLAAGCFLGGLDKSDKKKTNNNLFKHQ